jgi:hypothetical protein
VAFGCALESFGLGCWGSVEQDHDCGGGGGENWISGKDIINRSDQLSSGTDLAPLQ